MKYVWVAILPQDYVSVHAIGVGRTKALAIEALHEQLTGGEDLQYLTVEKMHVLQ